MKEPVAGHGSAPVGAKTSPVRLAVLLAILAVLVGALAYDQLMAKQAAIAAGERLEKEALKHNSTGYDATLTPEEKKQKLASGVLRPKDIQKIMNGPPTRVVKGERYVVEYYRWWGYIPINRHYVSVVYHGKEPNLRYSTHYTNSPPPKDDLPGYVPKTPPQDAATDDAKKAGMPPMAGGPPGGGEGQGKGKGKRGMKGERPAEETEDAAKSEPAPPSESKEEEKPDATNDNGAKQGDKAIEEKPEEAKTKESAAPGDSEF